MSFCFRISRPGSQSVGMMAAAYGDAGRSSCHFDEASVPWAMICGRWLPKVRLKR